ncbi:acyl-CoA dehydrogenase [Nakamurella sp. YIM 132087]|uniref:Acyl-CoA dehydrogenase n=1 Tax=Nakamurella alba TaxID=2665158 RepID=A0A7K1FSN9_9ACTN|nr:acyl-CoA dehydrogenase family protein [Nakamurella alba]MTD17090.1 acyl-CoA dehydrogenase [Nakamurella alba]
MHKHTPEISADERDEILSAARDLAKKFDSVGAECDRDNRFPTESVAWYKDSGLVEIAVPKRFGGRGADMLTTALVGLELAKGDPGIALAYNMHQAMVGIFRGNAGMTEEVREDVLTKVARDRQILCGPFSEARAGLTGLADTVAVPDGAGGWRISGKKNWSTLIEGADLIALNATVTDADGKLPEDFREHAAREACFIIPKDLPGVGVDRTWDTLGMRATGSQTLVLDEVPATEGMFAGNFRTGLIGEAEWAAVLFGGVYLGLGEKAYAEALRFVKAKHTGATMSAQDSAAQQIGYVQHALGRMRYELDVADRTLRATGQIAIDQDDAAWPKVARKAKWDVVKVACTEAAISVSEQGLRLASGSGYRRGTLAERLFRDARAGILHSFGTDQLFDFYGRFELGLVG